MPIPIGQAQPDVNRWRARTGWSRLERNSSEADTGTGPERRRKAHAHGAADLPPTKSRSWGKLRAVIALIYAHPHPARSRANRALLDSARSAAGVTVRSLYDAYPDFEIDVAAERRLLAQAKLVVWQHPIMSGSTPSCGTRRRPC